MIGWWLVIGPPTLIGAASVVVVGFELWDDTRTPPAQRALLALLFFVFGGGFALVGARILYRETCDVLQAVRERAIRGKCPNCLYSLRGNLSGVCPECGRRWKSEAENST